MDLKAQIASTFPDWNKASKITFKGTPGVGDFMMALNIAHFRSFILRSPILVEMHWYHEEDFIFHFEDPETIIERFEYILKFYEKKWTSVRVKHVFDSGNKKLWVDRFTGFDRMMLAHKHKRVQANYKWNDWLFRKDLLDYTVEDSKIVLWRPTFNAQSPRKFKNPLGPTEWEEVIRIIETNGYDVVEVDYRTPISEVLYHIKTCRATLSYEGMWHYIAKNLNKPMIVLSSDPITEFHTPDAFIYNPRNEVGFDPSKGHKPIFKPKYFYNFEKRLKWADEAANKRIGYLKEMLHGN